MPLFNHRRRHSWPYSGPERRAPLQWADIRVSKSRSSTKQQLFSFHTPTPSPFFSEGLDFEDDVAFAGIVRSTLPKSHHRLWPSSGKHKSDVVVSSVTKARLSSTSVSRRMIRPRFGKARSLFVHPTTASTKEDVLVVSCRAETPDPYVPARPVAGPSHDMMHRPGSIPCPDSSHVGRNHRRCDSEQPRSWREPSANIFTLNEE